MNFGWNLAHECKCPVDCRFAFLNCWLNAEQCSGRNIKCFLRLGGSVGKNCNVQVGVNLNDIKCSWRVSGDQAYKDGNNNISNCSDKKLWGYFSSNLWPSRNNRDGYSQTSLARWDTFNSTFRIYTDFYSSCCFFSNWSYPALEEICCDHMQLTWVMELKSEHGCIIMLAY